MESVITCTVDPDSGTITTAIADILQKISAPMQGIFLAAGVLALTILGIMTAMGQTRQFQAASFIFILKVGLGLAFIASLPMWYTMTVGVVQELSEIAGSLVVGSSLCPSTQNVWSAWDCIIGVIFNISGRIAFAGLVVGIVLAILTGGVAGVVFCINVLIFMLVLFQAMMRPMMLIVLSALGIGALFVLAPLAVAAFLFKGTTSFFNAWVRTLMGFVVMPVVTIAFTAVVFIMFESVMCGPNGFFYTVYRVAGVGYASHGCIEAHDTAVALQKMGTPEGETFQVAKELATDKDSIKRSSGINSDVAAETQSDSWWVGMKSFFKDLASCWSCLMIGMIPLSKASVSFVDALYQLILGIAAGSLTLYVAYQVMGMVPTLVSAAFNSNAAAAMGNVRMPGVRTAQQGLDTVKQGAKAYKGNPQAAQKLAGKAQQQARKTPGATGGNS